MTERPRKRPRDFSPSAKLVIDIATGQVEERPPTPEEEGKDAAAARAAHFPFASQTRDALLSSSL